MFVPLTPIRCLMRALDQFPHKIGVVCGDARFTYMEFGERCCRLAAALRKLGVHEGDRVAVLGFNTHLLLEAYFAVPIIGGILVLLNVRLHPAEVVQASRTLPAHRISLRSRFHSDPGGIAHGGVRVPICRHLRGARWTRCDPRSPARMRSFSDA